jgi:hypothetical protein
MAVSTPGYFRSHHNYRRKHKHPKLQKITKSVSFVPFSIKLTDGGYETTTTWKQFTIIFIDIYLVVKCLSSQTIRDVFSFQPGTIFFIVCNGIPFKLDADISIRSFRVLPGNAR